MTDPRFYRLAKPLSVAEICQQTGASVLRDGLNRNRLVAGFASYQSAGVSDICFLTDISAQKRTFREPPLVCLVASDTGALFSPETTVLSVADPRRAFTGLAAECLIEVTDEATSPSVVGPRSFIHPTAFIGPGVQIGHDCHIGAHVSIRFSLIGNGVTISSGARLGETGFSVRTSTSGARELEPHFGRVIVQDGCSIGANTTIDRGFLDDTIIGEATQIDNLCHIGHNSQIGRGVVMAAFCGVSGSVVIEDDVQIGGSVGITDHLRIGRGARIAASASVFKNVPAGETWGGMPARPRRQWLKSQAWLHRQSSAKQ